MTGDTIMSSHHKNAASSQQAAADRSGRSNPSGQKQGTKSKGQNLPEEMTEDEREEQTIDEASKESFPASDPPARNVSKV